MTARTVRMWVRAEGRLVGVRTVRQRAAGRSGTPDAGANPVVSGSVCGADFRTAVRRIGVIPVLRRHVAHVKPLKSSRVLVYGIVGWVKVLV